MVAPRPNVRGTPEIMLCRNPNLSGLAFGNPSGESLHLRCLQKVGTWITLIHAGSRSFVCFGIRGRSYSNLLASTEVSFAKGGMRSEWRTQRAFPVFASRSSDSVLDHPKIPNDGLTSQRSKIMAFIPKQKKGTSPKDVPEAEDHEVTDISKHVDAC